MDCESLKSIKKLSIVLLVNKKIYFFIRVYFTLIYISYLTKKQKITNQQKTHRNSRIRNHSFSKQTFYILYFDDFYMTKTKQTTFAFPSKNATNISAII